MNEKGINKRNILSELKKAKERDYRFIEGHVFGSMCTAPHPIARLGHSMFFEANLGNPGLYPGTADLERKVINMLATLLHGKNVSGHIVNGGNEANITALWIARNSSKKKKVILSRSAHFSIIKACDLLGLEPIVVGLDSNFRIDTDKVQKRIDDDVCAVIGVAGTTELGVVDPIDELSDICHGKTHLHVDAAFGGFVLPFLKDLGYNIPRFDFELPNVTSITVDPHKMGLATIPAGSLLIRNSRELKNIAVKTPYLTSEIQASLSGTRASGAVVGTYAVMKLLGKQGYREIVRNCMNNTDFLLNRLKESGFEIILDPPPMNIIGVRVGKPDKVCSELEKNGWMASIATNPKCVRLVIMPHITRSSINKFIVQFERTCRKLNEI